MLELFVFIQIDMETHTKKPRGMNYDSHKTSV